ncbi:hypothetical protein GCM10009127_24430 [Alteraurantiacibacter aestuarii]|uniref:CoA pyrophosphatase n=1 Tax=Alteraurantiacibacter aestuarii TaxID=650004 RepID=UPI0031D6C708
MSELFDHIADHFARGHQQELDDLHDHSLFAPATLREAAVLVAITERSEPGVILTHRPQDMRQHPGQVAFPGGKLDPGEDAITAALREADEELALPSAHVRVIGQSDRFVTGTGYDITPVIGLVPPDLDLRPNPREVSHWFEAPLGFILDPANHAHKSTLFDGRERDYIEIMWQEHRIWGVTAAIIANLSRRLETMGFSR